MNALHKYLMALGAFRAQTLLWAASARQLAEVAQQLDPELPASLAEAMAAQVCAELEPELRALLAQVVGLRHLVLRALEVG